MGKGPTYLCQDLIRELLIVGKYFYFAKPIFKIVSNNRSSNS